MILVGLKFNHKGPYNRVRIKGGSRRREERSKRLERFTGRVTSQEMRMASRS